MDTDPVDPTQLREGSIVVIRAFEEYPEHLFEVTGVWDDCVSGYSITGPLTDEYGEPAFDLIKAIQRL